MGLSILCKYGYKNLISIQGGVDKLRECGLDLTIAKCAKSGVWNIMKDKEKKFINQ